MLKLIRGGFFRYFHSTVFWICSVLSLIIAVFLGYRLSRNVCIDEFCFYFATAVLAVLTILSVGGEAGKQIKNKIVKGYSRTQVFFSELIVAYAIVSLFFVAFLVPAFLLNVIIVPHTPVLLMLQYIVGFYAITIAFTTVYCSLACMIPIKAVAIAICLVLSFTLYYSGFVVAERLDNVEYNKVGTITENGEWEFWYEKNPEYVDEPSRSVLTFYQNINPYGQRSVYEDIVYPYLFNDEAWKAALEATKNTTGNDHLLRDITNEEQQFLNSAPLYAVMPIPIFVLIGWLCIRKKELK